MLTEQITNAWLKYRLTGKDPKEAFLHVIANRNAISFDKVEMLTDIVEKHPEILEVLSDADLYVAFMKLLEYSNSRREILSFVELNWVFKYVNDVKTRTKIKELIFLGFLKADHHWDESRVSFNWALPESRKKALAVQALEDPQLGSMRKMQLAQEFGLPADEYARDYFKTLLWGRHYVAAEVLHLSNTDGEVIEVIMDNLNSCHITDALDIAKRFLPLRSDIIAQLEEMIEILF